MTDLNTPQIIMPLEALHFPETDAGSITTRTLGKCMVYGAVGLEAYAAYDFFISNDIGSLDSPVSKVVVGANMLFGLGQTMVKIFGGISFSAGGDIEARSERYHKNRRANLPRPAPQLPSISDEQGA